MAQIINGGFLIRPNVAPVVGLPPVLSLDPEDYISPNWSDGTSNFAAITPANVAYSGTSLVGFPGLTITPYTYFEGDTTAKALTSSVGWIMAIVAFDRASTDAGVLVIFSNELSANSPRLALNYLSDGRVGVSSTSNFNNVFYLSPGVVAGNITIAVGIANYADNQILGAINSASVSVLGSYFQGAVFPPAAPSLAARINGGYTSNSANTIMGRIRLYTAATAPDPADVTAAIQEMLDYYGL